MKARTKKELKNLDITLPSGWGELTAEQLDAVAMYMSLGIDKTQMYVMLSAQLAGLVPNGTAAVTESGDIGYVYYHRNVGNIILKAEQIAAFSDALSWIEKDVEPMEAPIIAGYTTPDRELYGVCFEQFITADIALGLYGSSQDEKFLRTLTAIMYPRKSYDPDKVIDQVKWMEYLPGYRFQAVLFWFLGVKQLLKQKYPFVFSDGQPAAELKDGDELLYGVLSALNEGRIVDNEKIKRMDTHEVLYELNLKIKTQQKRK